MRITSLFIISSSLIFGSSVGVSMPPRVFGECVQLSLHDLHCFGGKSSNKDDATVYKDMYGMYLGNYEGYTTTQMANSWNAGTKEMLQPNSDFLMVPVGYSGLMIVGGSGSVGNSSTPYIFDIPTQTWEPASVSNLKSAIPPLRGSAYATDGVSAGFIAGGATYGNVSTFFTDMIQLKYDYISRGISLSTFGSININRIGHSMIFDYNTLVIFGGQQLVNNQLKSVPMDQVSQFNTLLSTWTIINYKGSIPTPRSYFSVTKSVTLYSASGCILFGGINADTNVVSADKMYMVDYKKGTYETLNTENAPSARFGHSAVNHVIYSFIVMNGMDANGTVLSDFHVYDIRGNQWVDKFSTNGKYSESPYEKKIAKFSSEMQGFCWGLTVGVIVVTQLIGFGLYKYVEKKSRRHETNVNIDSNDNKESDQYNGINNNYNNYQSSTPPTTQYHDNSNYNSYPPSLPSSPPIDNNRPLPPAPIMSMPTGPEYNHSSSQVFYQQDVPYPQRQ